MHWAVLLQVQSSLSNRVNLKPYGTPEHCSGGCYTHTLDLKLWKLIWAAFILTFVATFWRQTAEKRHSHYKVNGMGLRRSALQENVA